MTGDRQPEPVSGRHRWVLQAGSLLPAAIAFAAVIGVAAQDGGERAATWYPVAILVTLLAIAALVTYGRTLGLPRWGGTAIVLFAAFTAWSYATILWSEVEGDAWDGANRGLLYLAIFSLFVALPLRLEVASWLVGAFSFVVAGLGVVSLWQAAAAPEPSAFFLLGRFAQPMNYQNANCALFMIAFWPAVFLASRRRAPLIGRGLVALAAALLPQLALLSQSRASLIAVPVSFLLYLVLVPGRRRSLLFLLPPAIATAATRGVVLDVFPAFSGGGDTAAAVDAATRAIIIWSLLAGVTGFTLAWLDQRFEIGSRWRHALDLGLALLAAVLVVSSLAVAVAKLDHPTDRAQQAWDDFKTPRQPTSGSYFSTGLGGNRYDLWRVAADQISGSPVVGVGVDNFAVDYLRQRRTYEEPSYPHSLELRVLAQTGAVGAVLLLAFFAAAGAALLPLRLRSRSARGLAAASLVSVFYWLLHGSVDWFWEIPALGAAAFALLGLAVSLAEGRRTPGRRLDRLTLVATLAAGVLGLGSLTFPWLAAQEMQTAVRVWRSDPSQAYARLERARQLNRLSSRPDLLAGAIAARRGDDAIMEQAFARAARRNPSDWYAHLELAVVATHRSQPARARRELAIARRLNPLEPALDLVQAAIREGRPVDQSALDRMFLERTKA
jgi:hypothetical protein